MKNSKLIKFLIGTSYSAITITSIAIIAVGRPFAKLKWGPLYSVEFCLLVASVGIVASQLQKPTQIRLEIPAFMKWPLLFSIWGLVLLSLDLLSVRSSFSPIIAQRLLQHSLLFVYPLIWISVGIWMAQINTVFFKYFLLFCFLANVLPGLLAADPWEAGIGPLFVPSMMFFYLESKNKIRSTVKKFILASFILVSFLPYCKMWFAGISLQRTLLVEAFVIILAVPFIVKNKFTLSTKQVWKTIGVYLSIFLVINFLALVLAAAVNGQSLRDRFLSNLQHGEDYPNEYNQRLFQARFRKFIWRQAIQDWKARPIVGIGFVPEVPSMISSILKNEKDWLPGEAPISGPHNSYLSVLARMGLIGLFIYLALLLQWSVSVRRNGGIKSLEQLILLFLAIDGLIYAAFNVGLEAPHHCLLLYIAIGALLVRSKYPDDKLPFENAFRKIIF